MRILFMGSGALACPSLSALLDDGTHEVIAAVTQPDRPRGRGLEAAACPAKERLAGTDVPLLCPPDVNDPGVVARLQAYRPDVVVVAAYGQILRSGILSLPPRGCVNLHASLLPKYRGAAPIQWAIANGEPFSGVTTMYMNERMDAGDILLQKRIAIGRDEAAPRLHDRLAREGAGLLLQTLADIGRGAAKPIAQVEADASYAPKLKKEDGRMDWSLPAETIYNRWRGFQPWPGSFCRRPAGRQGRLKVLQVRVEPADGRRGEPGEVLDVAGPGPLVAAGRGVLRLLEVQPEGKKPMPAAAYLRGHPLAAGDRLA